MLKDNLEIIKNYDTEIAGYMDLELKRQRENLELIASENIVSEAVLAAMGSHLTNKYAEGYPGKRYYGGCEFVDEIENIAIKRAKEMFKCDYANVQPHSGAQANMAVLYALTNPGDTILSMSLENGGHLSHGSPANMSGKYYNIVGYGVTSDGYIDYDDIEKKAVTHKPKVIIAGASAHPRKIDFKRFREIADKVDAVLMADIAHIAGLVVAGEHESPFPYAHVVTTTTHKTLRGPRGGMILAMNKEAERFNFNKAIFPGIQGGPLEHIIAAKAVAFKEALSEGFKSYQSQVVKNARVLGEELVKEGFKLVSGGTDNHLLLVDLTNFDDLTGKEMQARCDRVHITLNKNTIPGEPRSPFVTSGIRIGTPAITTRGMVEGDMKVIAKLLYKVASDFENSKDYVTSEVIKLCDRYPIY